MGRKNTRLATHRLTDAITKDELRIMTHTDYILNDELYKDPISIEQQYVECIIP